jgi:hypothetical protein
MREEVVADCRKVRDEELHNVCPSGNIVVLMR